MCAYVIVWRHYTIPLKKSPTGGLTVDVRTYFIAVPTISWLCRLTWETTPSPAPVREMSKPQRMELLMCPRILWYTWSTKVVQNQMSQSKPVWVHRWVGDYSTWKVLNNITQYFIHPRQGIAVRWPPPPQHTQIREDSFASWLVMRTTFKLVSLFVWTLLLLFNFKRFSLWILTYSAIGTGLLLQQLL